MTERDAVAVTLILFALIGIIADRHVRLHRAIALLAWATLVGAVMWRILSRGR